MLRRICKLIKMNPPVYQNPGLLFASGVAAPPSGAGYQTGCLYQHTDGTTSTAMYVNEGTYAVASWVPVGTSTQTGNITIAGTLGVAGAVTLNKASSIRLGAWKATGQAGNAKVFAEAMNVDGDGQLDVVAIFGESTSDLTGADSAKVGRYRHLVNGISCGHEAYGLVGQLVLKNATLAMAGAGLMGTLEVSTTAVTINAAYGAAGVLARAGGSAALITATTPLSGFLALHTAIAEYAAGYSVAYNVAVYNTAYPWTIGLCMPAGSVRQAVRIGDWAAAGATTAAILLANTLAQNPHADGQVDLVSVHGASAADLGGAFSVKVGRFRHVVNCTSCGHEAYGLVGQLVVKSTTLTSYGAGLMGTLEVQTASTVPTGAEVCAAGVIARVGGATITVGSAGFLAGVASLQLASTVTIASGGIHAAFGCRKAGAGVTWGRALQIEDAIYALGFKAAASGYDHGVAAESTTPSANKTHVIRVIIGTTVGYVPVFLNPTCA